MGWFMGEGYGDRRNSKKFDLRKVKYVIEAFYCLLSIYA